MSTSFVPTQQERTTNTGSTIN